MLIATCFSVTIAAWLLLGLAIEATVAVRQWRHLEALEPAAPDAGPRERLIRYGQQRALFQWLASAMGVVRVGLWLGTGTVALLYQAFFADAGMPGTLLFVMAFALLDHGLVQSLAWLRWWAVERRFGMSRMTPLALWGDTLRALGLHAGIGLMAVPIVLWPFGFWPFGIAWGISAVMMLAGIGLLFWARPHVIAPLFQRFRPLPPGALRTRLDAMMRRCNTTMDNVLVVDSSRRSNLANAYFTGIGRRKRIVLFDTLIERLEPDELEAVMAHELGHYRCGHLRHYYGLLALLLLVGYLACGIVFSPAVLNVVAPVAVVSAYLLLPAVAWPLAPWLSLLRRRYEYEADAFAARHADARALARALRKLLAHNLNAPTMDRWYAVFHATHPSGQDRLQRLAAAGDACND